MSLNTIKALWYYYFIPSIDDTQVLTFKLFYQLGDFIPFGTKYKIQDIVRTFMLLQESFIINDELSIYHRELMMITINDLLKGNDYKLEEISNLIIESETYIKIYEIFKYLKDNIEVDNYLTEQEIESLIVQKVYKIDRRTKKYIEQRPK